VMFHRGHHAPERGANSECLGHFWRVWVGQFWRAPKRDAGPKPQGTSLRRITWATQMSDLPKDGPVEWSDTWSGEDVADLQRALLANFDARQQGSAAESRELAQ
jgi:hypothetical protein